MVLHVLKLSRSDNQIVVSSVPYLIVSSLFLDVATLIFMAIVHSLESLQSIPLYIILFILLLMEMQPVSYFYYNSAPVNVIMHISVTYRRISLYISWNRSTGYRAYPSPHLLPIANYSSNWLCKPIAQYVFKNLPFCKIIIINYRWELMIISNVLS